MIDKKHMTEEDIKLQFITPAITSKWGLNFISMETKITDGKINLKGNMVIREKPKKADYVLYINANNPTDKIAEVNEDCVGSIPYTGLIRFKMYGGIDKNYFTWFIKSPCYVKQVDEQKAGGTIKHYGPSHLQKMVIPIPPLTEQKRIVVKLDEILPLCEKLK